MTASCRYFSTDFQRFEYKESSERKEAGSICMLMALRIKWLYKFEAEKLQKTQTFCIHFGRCNTDITGNISYLLPTSTLLLFIYTKPNITVVKY